MLTRHTALIASSHAYSEIERDCRDKTLKHAYAFVSPDFEALDTLAAMFVCLAEFGRVDEAGLSRIRDGGFADIVRLPRDGKNGKMDVEEAGYLTDTAYLTPTELSTKYYIVAPSEPMSEAVQNKMLKTLEEPPASARFIIFSNGNDMLSTVTSRCAAVRLEEFSVEKIENALIESGTDRVTALFAAAVGRGNIGAAEKFARDPHNREAYESAVNFLLNVKRSPQILPYAGAMTAAKDRMPQVIDFFEIIFRDIMAYGACGADAVVLKPAISDIIALSREYDIRTCLAVMPILKRARERIRLYGNAAGVTDELLFSILEVKAKCLK